MEATDGSNAGERSPASTPDLSTNRERWRKARLPQSVAGTDALILLRVGEDD
jgi:hypothetical protein